MFNLKNFEYRTSLPFIRWFYPNDSHDLEAAVKGRGFLPELLLAIALIFSFNSWSQTTESVGNLIVYILWSIIVYLLFTLALANAKTFLLPNVLIKPLVMAVVAFQMILALQTSNAGVLGSAIVGAVILGGVPYLLFQISAGRWIGGGDVKLGFVAGLLLGWKLSLFCLGVVIGLVLLSFLVEYITGKLSKTHTAPRIPTGVIWVVAIMISVIVGRQLLT